jgi:hypothetical protein
VASACALLNRHDSGRFLWGRILDHDTPFEVVSVFSYAQASLEGPVATRKSIWAMAQGCCIR